MAAAPPEEEIESSWPLPPMQYVDKYTDEAVASGTAPKPPACIDNEPYSMFGAPFFPNETIIRSLESQQIRRLYPLNYDHKREFRKISRSLLTNFLDLLDILVKAPDSEKRVEKIEDITLLFINMHHLINEFRQHQARETIKVMMSAQLEQRIDITERFKQRLEKVTEDLKDSEKGENESKPSAPLLQQLSMVSDTVTRDLDNDIEDGDSSMFKNRSDIMMCDIVDDC